LSDYQDAASRSGQRLNTGTNDRELFLTEFGDLVLQAWEEVNNYEGFTFTKNITQGKADTFPIIGRKRDAIEHEPGEIILGGRIEHNDVEITLDKILVDSVFIPEIDELMNHYEVRGPYARQLGESLSTAYDTRVARMHILASRIIVRPYGRDKLAAAGGGPLPSGAFDAAMATDMSKLEDALFKGVGWVRRWDIGGGQQQAKMGHAQYLNLARYTTIDSRQWTGSGNRAQGTVGPVAGLKIEPTNHIPRTNVTTGLDKYQGDFSDVVAHVGNQMAVGTLARRGIKVVMKDQPDRLGTLLLASKFNGHGILRPECSFEIGITDVTSVRGANHPDYADL
jgi:hypothetical protein